MKPQFLRLRPAGPWSSRASTATMFLLFDGVLRVEIDGKPVTEVGPGAIVGEMALLHQGQRMYGDPAGRDPMSGRGRAQGPHRPAGASGGRQEPHALRPER